MEGYHKTGLFWGVISIHVWAFSFSSSSGPVSEVQGTELEYFWGAAIFKYFWDMPDIPDYFIFYLFIYFFIFWGGGGGGQRVDAGPKPTYQENESTPPHTHTHIHTPWVRDTYLFRDMAIMGYMLF